MAQDRHGLRHRRVAALRSAFVDCVTEDDVRNYMGPGSKVTMGKAFAKYGRALDDATLSAVTREFVRYYEADPVSHTSAFAGVPEVVAPGETGILVPPADPQALAGALEQMLDSPALRRFAGVDLGRAAAPDETTILNFRHLLERHDLCGAMLDAVNHYLEDRGIRIGTGTIVDATIIHAPSSTSRFRPPFHWLRNLST